MSDPQFGVSEWDQSYVLRETKTLWGEPPVPYVLESAKQWFDPGRPAMEIPCGDGRNTVPLARHFQRLDAVDSSARALALARERIEAEELANVDFRTENIFDLSVPDRSFASVVCWDLLGHLKNPEEALRSLKRVCEQGAVIVANLFSLGDTTRGDAMTEIAPNQFIYDERFYFHYYSEQEATELLGAVDGVEVRALELTRWTEPPHEGYREYEHDHESWAMVIEVIE